MTTLSVKLPSRTSFYSVPTNCKQESTNYMTCVFSNGRPLFEKDSAKMTISVDTTRVEPGELIISANVTSSGAESDWIDNTIDTIITCQEFSEIEVIG